MNSDLTRLQPYPFEKLNALKSGICPPSGLNHIALSIGEPRHSAPNFVVDTLKFSLDGLSSYPVTKGTETLRKALCQWLTTRYRLPADELDPDKNVLPVSGTREALFAIAQAVINRASDPIVMMPNPFYQIYEGAAYLAGAEPWFLNTTAASNFTPDFESVPAKIWNRCQLLYICSPGNPTGAVMSRNQLKQVIQLADQYDFIIAADECYSELYPDESNPPPGLLEVAAELGRHDFERCVVFNSLSKRSNLPGLRSGLVAGDKSIIERFHLYRTYQGCAMPLPTQLASISAWQDEEHVVQNRTLYRNKFAKVLEILSPVLDVEQPDAGFYLWPRTPIDDQDFSQRLYAKQNLTVIPGSFLSRSAHGIDPGEFRIRMALVAPMEECLAAAERIREFTRTI